jgi:hypothetical protein
VKGADTKMEYTYSAIVSYRNPEIDRDGCVLIGDDDYDKCFPATLRHIEYYRELGYDITEVKIEKICKRCNGHGEIVVPSKRHKFTGKIIKCPDCKGKNSIERIF